MFWKTWADAAGRLAGRFGFEIAYKKPYDPELRAVGRDWPARADSMIGLRRMDNIQECIETVIRDDVPGDLIETGVWRGGATIFMRGVLKAYGDTTRTVWVADSFEGLPPPDAARYPADAGDTLYKLGGLAVGVDQVDTTSSATACSTTRCSSCVGWFKDTLPTAPIEQLAVMRLDGDMYESTWQAIEALYPKLSPGGFCIVDDYGDLVAQCQRAIHDYRRGARDHRGDRRHRRLRRLLAQEPMTTTQAEISGGYNDQVRLDVVPSVPQRVARYSTSAAEPAQRPRT